MWRASFTGTKFGGGLMFLSHAVTIDSLSVQSFNHHAKSEFSVYEADGDKPRPCRRGGRRADASIRGGEEALGVY